MILNEKCVIRFVKHVCGHGHFTFFLNKKKTNHQLIQMEFIIVQFFFFSQFLSLLLFLLLLLPLSFIYRNKQQYSQLHTFNVYICVLTGFCSCCMVIRSCYFSINFDVTDSISQTVK